MDLSSDELKTIMEQAGAQTQQVITLTTQVAILQRDLAHALEENEHLRHALEESRTEATGLRGQVRMLTYSGAVAMQLLQKKEAMLIGFQQLKEEFVQMLRFHQGDHILPVIHALKSCSVPRLTEDDERALMATIPEERLPQTTNYFQAPVRQVIGGVEQLNCNDNGREI